MSIASSLTITQLNPDGSVPVPTAPDAAVDAAAGALQREAQFEALKAQVNDLQEVLAKPLNEILSEHDKALESAAAWDAFGAQWLLAQRAMGYANAVLNSEEEDLGGSIAPQQLAHIARHKVYLRRQFRQG